MLVARISLTLSRHFSLSFIASGRSSGLHSVSSHSCWMYVRAGRPAFARPCVGVHKSISLMSLSLLLQQWRKNTKPNKAKIPNWIKQEYQTDSKCIGAKSLIKKKNRYKSNRVPSWATYIIQKTSCLYVQISDLLWYVTSVVDHISLPYVNQPFLFLSMPFGWSGLRIFILKIRKSLYVISLAVWSCSIPGIGLIIFFSY